MTLLVWGITGAVLVYAGTCIVTALPWLKKRFHDCYAAPNDCYTITIDDMPDDAAEEILDVLKEFSCRAVIFVVGTRAIKNTDIIKRIQDEGHILGNHSFVHYFYNPLSTRLLIRGFEMTEEAMDESPTIADIRSPHGYHTPGLLQWCRETNRKFWYWDMILWDFLPLPFSILRMQADAYMKKGGILCMHGRQRSVPVLRYICERITHAS